MKSSLVLFILVLLVAPVFVFAECNNNGTTVVFINGIFGEEKSARDDEDLLEKKFEKITKRKDVNFITGFNESHVGGRADLIGSVMQAYTGGFVDYDLTNILIQLKLDLKTQKILLVGHSQGTFYTNVAYNYLIENGVDANSIAVYNVATPADRVAGDGKYLTSSTDKIIDEIVRKLAEKGNANRPLPANITINIPDEIKADSQDGHSFSKVYLGLAPDRIISEIDSELNNLKANGDRTECFVPPEKGLVYRIYATGYAVLESADELAENSTTAPKPEQMAALANLLYNYLHNLGQNIAQNFAEIFAQSNPWLASVSSTLPEDIGDNPLPAVQLSVSFEDNSTPPPPPIILSPQDQLDDILEQMDILQHEMDALLADGNDNPIVIAFQPINTPPPTPPSPPTSDEPGGGGGTSSGGSQYFPKILISEVQVGGIGDDKQEFVELYNPNDIDIDLTGWYLQRKTASGQTWSTYAPSSLFSKRISAKGYFLIARAGYYSWLADVFVDKPITNDNSFVLKNPNGEISDKLGFGNAQDPELLAAVGPGAEQSIGRKVLADGTEADTDINLYDFELQNLTPKAKNTAYTAPIITPPTDTTAPQVSFNLDAAQTSDSFPINFTITDSVGAVSSGVASYIFKWQEDGGVWNDDVVVNIIGSPSSVAETRPFLGQDGKTYNFQVKAKDVAKNESDWQPETPSTTQVNIPKKVLINEIQIDSVVGEGGTDDDWVELYNPNDVDVSLAGWSIQRASSTGKIYHVKNFADDAVILANGYFLVVKNDANELLLQLADMTCSDLQISDDNTIYLANNTEEITAPGDVNISDKVGFGLARDFETLPAFNPPETKSIERKIIGGDTDNNSADFRISDNPTPKASFMQTSIEDATEYNYTNNPIDYGNGGAPYYNLSIEWSSRAPDLAFFQVQYKLNDGEWKDWLSPTNDIQGNFKGYYSLMDDQKIYSFRVKAQDNNGNQSDWSQVDVDLSSPVVINEIALYGTNAMSGTSGDQWIELYNRTDNDIDLTGWSLISIFNAGSTVTLSGTIPKKGYFILEKEGALLDLPVPANQVQFFTNTLSTNSMVLYDSDQRFIDRLYIKGANWSQGMFINRGGNYCSWERVSPYAFGGEERNWKKNEGVILNGNDRAGHSVYGTPGAQNNNYKMYTILPPAFGEDTTIKSDFNPYFPAYLTKVFENTTLTIEPGVILKFLDNLCGLQIDGTLKAIGTDGLGGKIVFTSSRDSDYGGNTNPDNDGIPGFPGEWMGLYFTEKSKDSALENILLRFAGADHTNGRALLVEKSIISLKNSTLEKNDNVAMDLVNSNSVIDSVQFLQNNSWSGYGILVQGGSPEIKNSYFGENKYGIYMNEWNDIPPAPVLDNNTFGPLPNPLDPENKVCGPNTIADIFDASAPPAPPAPLQMLSLEEITIDLEPVTPSNEPIISDEIIILEEMLTEEEAPTDAIVF